MSQLPSHRDEHLPVLCFVQLFTSAKVIIAIEIPDSQGNLLVTVAQKYTYLQPITAPHETVSIGECVSAAGLTSAQQADLMHISPTIAWIPRWRCEELGLTPMGPVTEEASS